MLTTKKIRRALPLPHPKPAGAAGRRHPVLQQLPRVRQQLLRHRRNRNCSLRITQAACAGGLFIFRCSGTSHLTLRCQITSMEVRKMFGDTLLESSSAPRKGKTLAHGNCFHRGSNHRRLAGDYSAAFNRSDTSFCARADATSPVKPVTVEPVEHVPHRSHAHASGPRNPRRRDRRLWFWSVTIQNAIQSCMAADLKSSERRTTRQPRLPGIMTSRSLTSWSDDRGPGVKPGGPKRVVSQLTEAQLVNRVEPVYPRSLC